MQFEWDEHKRQETLARRGVDILRAARIFEGEVLTWTDDRKDYGETRLISVGLVEGVPFVVVHVRRGERTRLITAWKGGRNDAARYQAGIARRNPGDG